MPVGPVGGRPLFGYGASLALLLGAALLSPAMLLVVQRPLARAFSGSGLVEARVALGNLGRMLRRNAVTISAGHDGSMRLAASTTSSP